METNWNQYFFDFIQTHLDKHWDWKLLSSNPNITMDIVEANPNKPWNWQWLSENPNITWDIVLIYHDIPWNWDAFSSHEFNKEKQLFELRVAHQKFVQEHLFEEFVKAYMHPNRIVKLLNMGYSIDELDAIL